MSHDHYATDVVSYHARRQPDAPAIEDLSTGQVLSWRAFEGRVAGLAGALAEDMHVKKGDRVAALGNNDPWQLILYYALQRLGAIFVPLNFRLAQAELEFFCTDSEPVLMVHDAAWQETAVKVAAGAGIPKLASYGVEDTRYDIAGAAERARPLAARPVNRTDDTNVLLYTSGTTGRPKGARSTYKSQTWQTLNVIEPYDLRPGSKYLAVLPFFHAAGLNSMTGPTLSLGGTVAILPTFDPQRIVSLFGDPAQGITHFSGAPVMYQVMATMPNFDGADFSTVVHAQVGGGFLNYDVTKAFHERGLALSPGYGSTEMGPIISIIRPADTLRKFGTCGSPIQHVNLRIVGADGEDVALGEAGELWAHGPSITPGYWNRTQRDNDSSWSENGEWFRSGDAIVADEEGFLTIVDRLKDMYKSGGENVYPAEVERILAEHPDVADAAVIPVVDERWGEVGRALLVPRAGVELDHDTVAEHCRARLAKFKVPAEFLTVPPFERNVTGKLPKADLKRRYGSGAPTVAGAPAGRLPVTDR